jgi:hypothetical protein
LENSHEGWDILLVFPHYWDVVIDYYVSPNPVVVDPQVVNAEAQHSLLLEDSFETAIAVGQGVAGDSEVEAVAGRARVVDAPRGTERTVKHFLFAFK